MPSKKKPKRLPSTRKVSKTTRLKDRVRTWKSYGIVFESYESAMEIAEEIEHPDQFCNICKITNLELKSKHYRGLCLDHDHKSNMPRGFLCGPCNSLVAFYEKEFLNDRVFYLISEYLKRSNHA